MRYLIILILLLTLWALIFWRLRPYIAMARRVLGIMKDARHVANDDGARSGRSTAKPDQKLVRCVTCKTWIPGSRAIRLRSQSASYCSNECLENAVTDINSRRSASGRN